MSGPVMDLREQLTGLIAGWINEWSESDKRQTVSEWLAVKVAAHEGRAVREGQATAWGEGRAEVAAQVEAALRYCNHPGPCEVAGENKCYAQEDAKEIRRSVRVALYARSEADNGKRG